MQSLIKVSLSGYFFDFLMNLKKQSQHLSIFGSFFPLPRILYAMSSDGLIFKFFSRISNRFKTPIVATVLAGLASGEFFFQYKMFIFYIIDLN